MNEQLESRVKKSGVLRFARNALFCFVIGYGIGTVIRYLSDSGQKLPEYTKIHGKNVELEYISQEQHRLEIKILKEIDANGDRHITREELDSYNNRPK